MDGFRLHGNDTLYIWWTTASLEFLHTTPCGSYARAQVIAADHNGNNAKSTETWGASLTSASVDIMRAVLHKHLESGAYEIGFDLDPDVRGAFLCGYVGFSAGPRDYLPAQEIFRAKPPLLNAMKELSAGSYLVRVNQDIVPTLQDLVEFGKRADTDRVYVLIDLRSPRVMGLHVLRKDRYGAQGVEFVVRQESVQTARRTKKLVPASVATQNPEGWLRLDATTLLQELINFESKEGLILSVSLENPLGILVKPKSRAPRYLFVMQARWLPEDIDYALGCKELGAHPVDAASSIASEF